MSLPFLFALLFLLQLAAGAPPAAPGDAAAMRALAAALRDGADKLGWSSSKDPCTWPRVSCDATGRVSAIQVGNRSLAGTLPHGVFLNLTALTRLELMINQLSGPLPSLAGLSALQFLLLHNNNFSSVPDDFFSGMSSLVVVTLDHNPFAQWQVPSALMEASGLKNFSANDAGVTGAVPEFFATAFSGMDHLALAFNYLSGLVPAAFASAPLRSLWLNNQQGAATLSGKIDFVQNMTSLVQLWLQSNSFSGAIPELGDVVNLRDLQLRDNQLTGIVPGSLVSLKSLQKITLTNNLLQGPVPEFPKTVDVDMTMKGERFCLDKPGECDARVNVLLSTVKDFGYPIRFAEGWHGNDPCANWVGISCNADGNITVVNFQKMGLEGTISPAFAQLPWLQKLVLSNNNITGAIPQSLTNLTSLKLVDVSYNMLSGPVPKFPNGVFLNTDGNVNIRSNVSDPPSLSPGPSGGGSGSNSTDSGGSSNTDGGGGKSSSLGVIVGSVIGAFVVALLGLLGFCCYRRKQHKFGKENPNAIVIHPRRSGSSSEILKLSVAGLGLNGGNGIVSNNSSEPADLHVVEAGSMVISIQVLRNVTNNFSEDNILGRGGFGVVYKGELHDGTKIAVKRMESSAIESKGLTEFQSEIAVLTKVRHRHLVSLLGYCLDGNEKILVYEYMPQGTLSGHLFNWRSAGLKPLEWAKRLSIALDVARGVEYLHSLAHKSFIHRDLKPSNILLGDDLKAKVADFGLVRDAPEGKYGSVETRLAGTFGYLAPEYAATGRVTTKADVFSFGVILMELITGRKALDESQTEDKVHLLTWFRRMQLNEETFRLLIDPTIDLDEETFASISTIAELAGHCCAREPYQRPDMSHAVNVLSSLTEIWKPTDADSEDIYGIDLDMSLPQALKKWQAFEDSTSASSSFLSSAENTQTSIPTRPAGFAYSFTSADGR